ncbi:M20/M25/M40 family metallo-hydrolase [Pseudoalteromonas sp. DL2-H2.2]|uniref:M20/M25/M40 family metallo-hydrolase n=1 Tax=Pseudoalteromonas sp. DL2-H2.2 TaxID=2908889 RepID=UPI001F2B5275|nr:M20/M25/M40 family metallo-hydrolase [Pseudoalteromonas sp. DL2-H2.2]MCF2907993.1 M20/M25/M40 family metallo-hydrolase [Pseudoalteromonas sp. DL2-H2.2]
MINNVTAANWSGSVLWLKISLLWLCFIITATQASTQLATDLKILTSPEHAGRGSGDSEVNASARYIYTRFAEAGLETYYQSFRFRQGLGKLGYGHNVVATLPCNVQVCEKSLVISAHYDHLGSRGSRYYPGANDNASGVVVMLDIAKRLVSHQRHRKIIFVATDAEEKGLYGAHFFAATLNPQQVALNINLDMLAVNRKNRLYVLASKQASAFTQAIEPAFDNQIRALVYTSAAHMARRLDTPRVDWLRASDHYAFHKVGIPFAYFGIGTDPYHHTHKDKFDKIDLPKLAQVSEHINAFISALSVSAAP